MENTRFGFIDWGKGIAICLIVLSHFLSNGTTLKVVLFSFHVPVFYLMAGFLYKRDTSPKSILQKQVQKLVVPYTVYFLLSVLFSLVFLNVFPDLTTILLFNGYTLWNYPLWFVPVFFYGSVIFSIFYWIFKSNLSVVLMCFIAFAGAIIFDVLNVKELCLFGFNKVLFMIGFYCLGFLLRSIVNKIKAFGIATNIIALLIFAAFCTVAAIVNTGDYVSPMTSDYNNILFYIPMAIIGSVSFILMFVNLPVNALILSLSKNTIFIMSTHFVLLYIWRLLNLTAPVMEVTGGLATVALYLIISLIINKVRVSDGVSKYTGMYSVNIPG